MGKENKNIVAFIPARGGSKSIPYKNIKPIAGRPLIYWVLDAAVHCELIDRVFVSTDDVKIEEAILRYGNDRVELFRRNPETATDTASTESAMIEFAQKTDFDVIVLIQATSPLLRKYNLDEGIKLFGINSADSLVSVVKQRRFIWEQVGGGARPVNYDPLRRPLRQNFNGYFVENGAFYITKKDNLLSSGCRISGKTILYEMPEETYYELDEPSDWEIVERLLQNTNRVSSEYYYSILKNIKLFVTDVDGVLTDAGMYYSETGDEMKKFNTRDGKAFELLRDMGIKTAFITSENTKMVEKRARKLKIDYVFQGVSDKLEVLKGLCKDLGVDLANVVYIGDDVNDLEVLRMVGMSASPGDALPGIKAVSQYNCEKTGGAGCVREVADMVIKSMVRNKV